MSAVTAAGPVVWERSVWTERAEAHRTRADELTRGRRERSARGDTHPVDDFLFTYYSYRPALLRRWHPGEHVVLADAPERFGWRGYRRVEAGVTVDGRAVRAERAALFANIANLLARTATRPARFGCFGLHEWAMVYREPEHRHGVPLRLGQDGTDAVVEAHGLRCTHFDAYRFFTPEAVSRNAEELTRDRQSETEQPGCLHAGMDVYKWAVKLGPLVPGDLLLDTFTHARQIRDLDMEASPYDLPEWGYAPVRIETEEGKAEYVRRQRALAERSQQLRGRLLAILTGDDV
ncbi:hypothetical protein GCM10009808_07010 [Microbacterium sediminicola]|uniref:3-methyladenine DNA glycosylase n=1 Tax=Microbacterium sediminicola TaxID=415210 RepID=A0ABP4TSX4_9MICO